MLLTAFPMISLILVAIVISLAKFGGHGIGGIPARLTFSRTSLQNFVSLRIVEWQYDL